MERSNDDIIVSLLVAVLLDKLSSQSLIRDFGSVWHVQSELRALSNVLGNIQRMLNFAEQAQTKNLLVKGCLRNLRDVAYRAEDILDEFIYEARREKDERYQGGKVPFFPFSLNAVGILRKEEIIPLVNEELIKELEKIEKKLEAHYCRGSEIWQSHGINHEIDIRSKSGSLVDEYFTLERKEDEAKIKDKLLSSHPDHENQNQVSVVAIVGLGGVGKTTLAQLVYNDPVVEEHFERRAWICVSTDFNAVRLISAILESLTGKNPKLSNLEPLQRKLRDELRGKRCLIVLDDVWTEVENDWKALRVAFMEIGEGSRIIVTTRSRRVSSMMHPMYTHDLTILSDEECWSIMKKRIFMDQHNGSIAPSLEALGRKIARKCKGLPLAASTLAGLLSSTGSDLTHWQSVLNSFMWYIEERDVPAALSLSYYFLPTQLRHCFAYCSVFPQDYKFKKEHLVQLWIAEGFIRSKSTRIGGQYFDDLVHRSFFQHDNKDKYRFVMHDLVHDLAEAVSGEVYGRFECGESSSSHSSSTKETPRYLSMCCIKHMSEYKNHGDDDDRRLSTLIDLRHHYCHYDLSDFINSFGGRLRYLRVLDLPHFGIGKFPDDIGDLKYLHHINLSYAREIRELPESLCDLHNLSSLILCHSGIRMLPRGMKYLRNLQHLDCYGTPLRSLPQGIGRLTSLNTLSLFPVSLDCGIREMKELSQLEGVLQILRLENVIDPLDAREADLMNKMKVDELTLAWGVGSGSQDDEVFEGLRPHTELRSLRIGGYRGLTFPRWLITDLPSYNKLVSLTFTSCWKCRVLPPTIGELPLLESLFIKYMFELEEWSSNSSSSSSTVWEETKILFPSLLRLTIEDCPKLRILPQPLLSSPRLCEWSINGCPSLRWSFPREGLSKLTSLKYLHLGDGMEGLVLSLDHDETDQSTTLPPNLNHLYIDDCESLPKGLRNLSSLQHLKFGRDCKVHYSPEEELPTNLIVTRK